MTSVGRNDNFPGASGGRFGFPIRATSVCLCRVFRPFFRLITFFCNLAPLLSKTCGFGVIYPKRKALLRHRIEHRVCGPGQASGAYPRMHSTLR